MIPPTMKELDRLLNQDFVTAISSGDLSFFLHIYAENIGINSDTACREAEVQESILRRWLKAAKKEQSCPVSIEELNTMFEVFTGEPRSSVEFGKLLTEYDAPKRTTVRLNGKVTRGFKVNWTTWSLSHLEDYPPNAIKALEELQND